MKTYRIYDKKQMKYRTDLVVDQEWRILQIDVNNRTRLHELDFVVERWFIWIFEGDIIRTSRWNREWPVDFDQYKWVFDRKNWIFTERLHDLFDNKRKVEVIWNIHDKDRNDIDDDIS